MFEYIKIFWPFATGICLYAGYMHLQIGLRRPIDRIHTLFGLSTLSVAMAILGRVWFLTASTPRQYQQGVWLSSTGFLLVYVFLPWFIHLYAHLRHRWPTVILSAIFIGMLIVNFLQPYSLVLSGPPVLTYSTSPWGEQFTSTSTPPTQWIALMGMDEILAFVFVLAACIEVCRHGPRSRAWGLILGIGPFAVCLLIDILHQLKILPNSFVRVPGYLVLVIMMSSVLTREWRRYYERMNAVLDNVPAAVYLKQLNGRYLFVNRQFEELHRLPTTGILGKTDAQILDESRATAYAQADREALVSGPLESEEVFEHGGTSLTYSSVRFALRDTHGNAYALCGVASNITERKQAEERIRQLNRSYAALSNINQLIIHEHDPQVISERACQIIVETGGFRLAWIGLLDSASGGLRLRAHAGATPDTLAIIDKIFDDPEIGCAFTTRALATGIRSICNDIEHDPSATGWREAALQRGYRAMVSFPLTVSDKCVGTLNLYADRVNLFDAEELKLLDELARDIAFAFEIREREHERSVLEQQLTQSQKMEAIGQLAGGIAHDFNNILSAVIGNTELVRMDLSEGHPAQSSIQEILRAGQRAKELVQRILAFGRPQVHQTKVIQLQPVLDEAIRLLRATLPARVELTFSAADSLPPVCADASQIHQVVLNLITNAWHAMEDNNAGRIAVRLEACQVDETLCSAHPALRPGPYIRISVIDNGKGMDAETLSRIFEPFFTTKPAGQGAGLGLSVVHGIVRSHGGALIAESQPGMGAAFHVYLPAAVGDVAAIPNEPSIAKQIAGRGERILYIDDEQPLVFLATRFLERFGYRVEGYSDAVKALAAFRDNPQHYDLVITDYNMPGMSGIEVARQVLQIRPVAPVVLTSGYLRPDEMAKARAMGIREIVSKPNSLEDLGPLIQRVLSQLV